VTVEEELSDEKERSEMSKGASWDKDDEEEKPL
jgi:hypothetical protein